MWWLVLCVLAAGCIQTKDEYVLNPDGSGKVRHEAVMQPMNLNFTDEKADPEKQARQLVGKELSDAVGVNAWKDVAFERMDDGKVRFQGTAYFPDVAKVRFHNGGFKQSMLKPSWTKNVKGQLVLQLEGGEKEPAKFGDKQKTPPVSEEEIKKQMAEARSQVQQMKPMLALFAATKNEMSFRLPWTVVESNNFQKGSNGTMQVAFRGEKFVEAIDKLMEDDAWVRKAVREGRDFKKGDSQIDEMMNETLYGQKGPVRLVVAPGGKAQFDYAAEVAAAKKTYPQMVAQLKLPGSVATSVAPVTAGANLKSVKVGGARVVWFSDSDNDVRPFNYDEGYTLVLVADFGGAVHEVSGGRLTVATASTGENLLPERDWDKKLSFPRLSKDKTKTVFEVKFKMPGASVTGLKELSGELEYLLGGTAKTVDLGFDSLQAGSVGKQFDATIKSVKTSQWQKEKEGLELRIELPKHVIKSVTFYDATGAKLPAEKGSTSWSDENTTLEYTLSSKWPAKGRVVLEMYDGMKKYKVPFSLKDISLTGQPLR